VARKYQVFVSSTFEDLKEERPQVLLKLFSLSCIPNGMECFSLEDVDKWKLIQGVIDDSDFFILILGNWYGSTNSSGKSFTEMEYDYAVETDKPLVAFLKRELITGQESKQQFQRLKRFRRKVTEARIVRFWDTPMNLANMVADAIVDLKSQQLSGGWIRAQTPGAQVEKDCIALGVTAIYNHRSDAAGDMLADIGRSSRSCRMYSGIYLAGLVKNDDFLRALQIAAERGPNTPYQVVYCSLNPAATGADRSLLELWARRESAQEPEELARRIRERGYSRFQKIQAVHGVEATYRYFSNFVLTHSLLVIDNSIVYFTPYDWVHDSGENCLTLRLEDGEWAKSFVREADVIDREFSVIAPEQEMASLPNKRMNE
jgi:hypothetical protein